MYITERTIDDLFDNFTVDANHRRQPLHKMRQSTATTTSIAAIALLGSSWAAPTFDGQTVLGLGNADEPSHPIPQKPDTKLFNPLHRGSSWV